MCTAAETMCMAFIADGHDAILDCYDPKVNYIVTCYVLNKKTREKQKLSERLEKLYSIYR